MSKRFVVDKSNINITEDVIEIIGDEVHHINVLRYFVGDILNINEYEVKITKLEDNKLVGKIVGEAKTLGVPKCNITLIASYLKSDKTEYVVQKAVELGVKQIIPVITKNTVVKFDEKSKLKKKERLEKIKKEAIEQCGRTDDVKLCDIQELSNVDFNIYDKVLICHEKGTQNLKDELEKIKSTQDIKNIAVIVGPEGGLDESEIPAGTRVCFGQRILRAETASIYILSILGYEFF